MQLVNKQTAGKAAQYQTVAVKLANAGYRNGTEPTTTAKTKMIFLRTGTELGNESAKEK